MKVAPIIAVEEKVFKVNRHTHFCNSHEAPLLPRIKETLIPGGLRVENIDTLVKILGSRSIHFLTSKKNSC